MNIHLIEISAGQWQACLTSDNGEPLPSIFIEEGETKEEALAFLQSAISARSISWIPNRGWEAFPPDVFQESIELYGPNKEVYPFPDVPMRDRTNPELRSLLDRLWHNDPNGYCCMTDGSEDALTDEEAIEALKANLTED